MESYRYGMYYFCIKLSSLEVEFYFSEAMCHLVAAAFTRITSRVYERKSVNVTKVNDTHDLKSFQKIFQKKNHSVYLNKLKPIFTA